MNTGILILGVVLLVILVGILVSLLRAGYREKAADTNKKVVLQGGKSVNPNAGLCRYIFDEDLSQTPTAIKDPKRQNALHFLCLTEQRSGRVYRGQFVDRKITIGRKEKRPGLPGEGILDVKDSKVSHKHCCVYWKQNCYVVEDCGSANHTWVNGTPVTSAMPLKNGDRLRLAKKTYEVRFSWNIGT